MTIFITFLRLSERQNLAHKPLDRAAINPLWWKVLTVLRIYSIHHANDLFVKSFAEGLWMWNANSESHWVGVFFSFYIMKESLAVGSQCVLHYNYFFFLSDANSQRLVVGRIHLEASLLTVSGLATNLLGGERVEMTIHKSLNQLIKSDQVISYEVLECLQDHRYLLVPLPL